MSEINNAIRAANDKDFIIGTNEDLYANSIWLTDAKLEEPKLITQPELVKCSFAALIEIELEPDVCCNLRKLFLIKSYTGHGFDKARNCLNEVSEVRLLMSLASIVSETRIEKDWSDDTAIISFLGQIDKKSILLPVSFLKQLLE